MPKIGNLSLSNDLVAAPLAGISDYSFRQLMRNFGIGLTYTEMISAAGVCRGDKKSKTFTFGKDEHPIVAQIFGNNPDEMTYAACYFEEQGADIIDINFGCPVKKVIKQGAGSSLQRDLKLSEKIIKAIQKKIKIPLTIKCRLGWNKTEQNYLTLAKIARDNMVSAVCLHPRYATQQFTGKADWSKMKPLAQIYSGPLIGSGDLFTKQDIQDKRSRYNLSFFMLGRGLMGNPWLISDALNSDNPPTLLKTLETHFQLITDAHGELKGSRLFRKFIAKYVRGLPNAAELRLVGNKIESQKSFKTFMEKIKNNNSAHLPFAFRPSPKKNLGTVTNV